jgi:hypothetical protein
LSGLNDAPPVQQNAGMHDQIEPLADASTDLAWRSSFIRFTTAFACLSALAAIVIGLTNPYGNLPDTLFDRHAIAQGNQRFQYPAIARSGNFDSVLIGTSTSGILRPPRLNEVLGGTFANLAMDSARAWEQTQIATLFRRSEGPDASLIVGIDVVWCDKDADKERTTERGFPGWMYDDNVWNDLPRMFNATSLDYSWKRLRLAAGWKSEAIAPDGYKEFLPDETNYDLAKVKGRIGPWSRDAYPAPNGPPQIMANIAAPPALVWIDEILGLGWTRAALVFMPVHVTAQPRPGSSAFEAEQSCKARISEIASRYNTPVIDFRIPSPITLDEANYWDILHYRVPVGDDIAAHLATALKTLQDDTQGRWRILNAPKAKPWR